MTKITRTFEVRATEILTAHSPFKTVEEYTEWFLEKKGLFDMTEDGEKLNQFFKVEEVPLHTLKRKTISIIEIVEEEIDQQELWDLNHLDTDQFLVMGTVQEVGASLIYRQGHGSYEGKLQRRQDAWLDSLD